MTSTGTTTKTTPLSAQLESSSKLADPSAVRQAGRLHLVIGPRAAPRLLKRDDRERFFGCVDEAGSALTIHVVDASREVRRERVAKRNLVRGPTFSMSVPADVFELASDLWEPLDSDECQGRDVRFIRTDAG